MALPRPHIANIKEDTFRAVPVCPGVLKLQTVHGRGSRASVIDRVIQGWTRFDH